ncbi:alkaline shock response membrane anchor protein AmaP [Spiractinospora alimapuensis]|uniref:DUF6286 domain-containing protein n=1 Tax=Spiractinospora alimapuensis TaxID=2820884 RepID=UPI001F33E5EC|nr:DUF6286 domain-containing protein [Spiractinospora alimapuensis]QVQ50321.1 alkaline shock response membrane anchor protein AmaP [Spiractinospora alimapuensis]
MTAIQRGTVPVVAPRRARRVALHTFRPQRTWPAVLVAAGVAIVAVLVAAEAVATVVGRPLGLLPMETVTGALEPLAWRSTAVLVAGGVACAVGVILLLAALLPGRGGYVPLRTEDPSLVVGVSRAGLRRHLAAAVADMDGVHQARVAVRRRRVKVRASTWARPERARRKVMARTLRDTVRERLDALGPLRRLRVRARIGNAKG